MAFSTRERINRFIWETLPGLFVRPLPRLAIILLDGAFLKNIPFLGGFSLPLSLVLGILLGLRASWGGEFFVTSGLTLFSVTAVSSFSPSLGLGVWVGYVGSHALYFLSKTSPMIFSASFLSTRIVPLFLAYGLLGFLLFRIPILSRGLWSTLPFRVKRGILIKISWGLQAALQGLLVWTWTLSLPTLIRPLYTWAGTSPPIMSVCQNYGGWIALVGTLAALLRQWLQATRANASLNVELRTEIAHRLRESLAVRVTPARRAISAIMTTFFLSGLIAFWFEAILLFLVIWGVPLLIEQAGISNTAWPKRITRVPLLARVIAGTVLTAVFANLLLLVLWHGNSFRPILWTVVFSTILFNLLIPRMNSGKST